MRERRDKTRARRADWVRPPAGLRKRRRAAGGEAQWYKDAIIYELHVRSFQDSNGDGIGDFNGLRRRLPYLQDLGVTTLWLLPFYPSPLRDDGYDISDYEGVHPDYGTLGDFRRFLDDAHRLGLRVITELVINHSSDQHPWFRRARAAAPGTVERNFYVWSDSPDRYREARIIFPDFERSNWSWDPVARAYYWHRFYSHQPDLNFENPATFDAIIGVLDHWFQLGVDGMRLDAVPYLMEREGTPSENLAATHTLVKRLRAYVDRNFSNRIFIAEANQWPEDAAAYFGNGDESHMVFHFPLMPRLFMAIRQEDRLPIADILAQTPRAPEACQWALFLRNHDELTLEMVTEEERLYMYHVYAAEAEARINLGIRRRLAPLLRNHRRRIELMNALLLSLQGTPVLYYGDEIGMGDNIYLGDRNGVRTPMQWSGDRNAGFSDAQPQRLFLPLVVDDEYHHQSVHVAQQLANEHSLLWWMKRLIAVRKRYQAFGRGDLDIVDSANSAVLAFIRRWRDQQVLVVANLSRFVQHVELDLRTRAGRTPVEAFGRGPLPRIGKTPYALTLAPHGFFWLELTSDSGRARSAVPPRVDVEQSWEQLLAEQGRGDLEALLPPYIQRCTAWNLGARTVLAAHITHALPIGDAPERRWLAMLRVTFNTGEPEQYLLPLGCRRASARSPRRADVIAELRVRSSPRSRFELFDAGEDAALAAAMLRGLGGLTKPPHHAQGIQAVLADGVRLRWPDGETARTVRRTRRGGNAVVSVGRRLVIKLFRLVEPGPSPEIEIRSRLREAGFPHVPALLAAYRWDSGDTRRHEPAWIGIVQEFVDNQGEAWEHAVAAARDCLRRVRRTRPTEHEGSLVSTRVWGERAELAAHSVVGAYGATAEKLGARTAELHRALGKPTGDPAFAPEPFSPFSGRSAYQRMRRLAVTVLQQLATRAPTLEDDLRPLVDEVLDRRSDVLSAFEPLLRWPVAALRIRCHGNLHLGQVLYAGDDLVIIDFDGEPGRPVYERRLKQSPLHDVATMVRSFHYAGHAALDQVRGPRRGRGEMMRAVRAMRAWQRAVSAAFVSSYRRSMEGADLLPDRADDVQRLFHAYLVERTLYEVGFELNRGSRWIRAPLSDLPAVLTNGRDAPGHSLA